MAARFFACAVSGPQVSISILAFWYIHATGAERFHCCTVYFLFVPLNSMHWQRLRNENESMPMLLEVLGSQQIGNLKCGTYSVIHSRGNWSKSIRGICDHIARKEQLNEVSNWFYARLYVIINTPPSPSCLAERCIYVTRPSTSLTPKRISLS